MSARKEASAMKDHRRASAVRRSIQPRPQLSDTEAQAATAAAAAAAAAQPAKTVAPVAAAAAASSSSSSSSSSSTLPTFDASAPSVRAQHLRALLASALDRAWNSADLTDALLRALPSGVSTSSSALQVTRLGEKALQSARRNILQELEVILLEHGLPAKLAEVEYLAARGGMLLPDGSVLTQQDAPAPAHALRSMMAQARRAEKIRLEALCAQMEEENEELRSEITKQAEALKTPTSNVAKAQQFTDTVYDTLINV